MNIVFSMDILPSDKILKILEYSFMVTFYFIGILEVISGIYLLCAVFKIKKYLDEEVD